MPAGLSKTERDLRLQLERVQARLDELEATTGAIRRGEVDALIVEEPNGEERIRFLAYHDALTRLPNRALFQDRLVQIISDAARRKENVAVMFVDLDHFKDVNDALGHAAGDIVLKEAAERLTKCARITDTVARLGGDEFVVVLGGIKGSTDAVIAADRIKREFAREFSANGTIISMTCSIGISVYPTDGTDSETMLKHADTALYCAKDHGRNGWEFFTHEMNGQALRRLKLETAIRQALRKDQLFLEYQPQVELSTGKIVGAEALLRWRHPEMGLVPPNTFIPVAESTGEIIGFGEWVLRTACKQAKQWQEEEIPPVVVAVNVSAAQLKRGDFPAVIRDILHETGLAPEYLELEITESMLVARDDQMAAQMVKLREMGVSLALDDFGTGYSSLSYLRRFRFDKLKIDGSFVQALNSVESDAEITAAIISMGKIIKVRVIAECVETEEQLDFLRSHEIDEIQGYYFSRPLGPTAFAEKCRSHALVLAALARENVALPMGKPLKEVVDHLRRVPA